MLRGSVASICRETAWFSNAFFYHSWACPHPLCCSPSEQGSGHRERIPYAPHGGRGIIKSTINNVRGWLGPLTHLCYAQVCSLHKEPSSALPRIPQSQLKGTVSSTSVSSVHAFLVRKFVTCLGHLVINNRLVGQQPYRPAFCKSFHLFS